MHGFSSEDLGWGCVVSILFLVGKQTLTMAYAEGPGGPVNTIAVTQSLYQVLLDVFVDGQIVGAYGWSGFGVGILGTIVIALGNMIVKKAMGKSYDSSPLRRYL